MVLSSARVAGLLRLVGEAHELAADPGAARKHVLGGIGELLGAPVGMMLTDECFRAGSPSRVVEFVDVGWASQSDRAQVLAAGPAEPALIRLRALDRELAGGGTVTRRRVELLADREWYASPYVVDHLLAARLDDTLYSARALSPGRAHGIMLWRARGDRPFSDEDRELLALLHREHRWPAAPAPLDVHLSPRQRDTLQCLLEGRSIKECADALGLSASTVAEYVQAIYRALGVRSRAELLSRFIPRSKQP